MAEKEPANKVLIYQDFIQNNFPLYRALAIRFGKKAVDWCTARDILGGRLDSGVNLFVMPGGADRFYAEKLDGEGNRRIRDFVAAGGGYLGICAGAYYACAAVAWAKGTPHEIVGPRALGFFSGTAVGPIGGAASLNDRGDPVPESLTVSFIALQGEVRHAQLLYHGGPQFVAPPSGWPDAVSVVARRQTGPEAESAAIVAARVGKGVAVLSSVHPEYDADGLKEAAYHIDPARREFLAVAASLEGGEEERRALWDLIHHTLEKGASPA